MRPEEHEELFWLNSIIPAPLSGKGVKFRVRGSFGVRFRVRGIVGLDLGLGTVLGIDQIKKCPFFTTSG